jgi:hypothetical protein
MSEMNLKNKSLQKRLLLFFTGFALISILTFFTKGTPIEDFSIKTLVLDKNPHFTVIKDFSSKNTSIEHVIIFTFKEFKDSLRIYHSDLEFADRKGIKEDIKKGDTVEVTYEKDFLFIAQLSKKGKTYLNPTKAFEVDSSINFWILLSTAFASLICLISYFLCKKGIKYIGWYSSLIILITVIILFILLQVEFSNSTGYPEFE